MKTLVAEVPPLTPVGELKPFPDPLAGGRVWLPLHKNPTSAFGPMGVVVSGIQASNSGPCGAPAFDIRCLSNTRLSIPAPMIRFGQKVAFSVLILADTDTGSYALNYL